VDTTTTVRWAQTSSLFADVRKPAGLCVSAPLEECDETQLKLLGTQNSFSGVCSEALDPPGSGTSVLTWRRDVDWQPPGGPPDVGRCRWINDHKIYEDDLDGDTYHEVWERLPESVGPCVGFSLKGDDGRIGVLVICGDCFLFSADRTKPLVRPMDNNTDDVAVRNLRFDAALDALPDLQAKRAALTLEGSYGRMAADNGSKAWRIETSTIPGREGQTLFDAAVTVDSLRAAAKANTRLSFGAFPPAGGWALTVGDADMEASAHTIPTSTFAPVATSKYTFSARTAIVTGAAGGIGRAIAAAFAAQGARVVLVDRDASLLAAVSSAIARELPLADLHSEQCDLSSDEACAALAARVGKLCDADGGVGVLVNNAGVEHPTPLSATSPDFMRSWSMLLDNNVSSMTRLTRAMLPLLRPGSSVINQSSIWGLTAVADFSAYCASKHAVLGLTRSLAFELGPVGVRVNAVCPGWIRTEAAMRSLTNMAQTRNISEVEMEKEILRNQAMRVFLNPSDIGPVYLYLGSTDSASLTGQAIVASRGEVMN
jgi:3-hydroxybutyrate dehydrogenase